MKKLEACKILEIDPNNVNEHVIKKHYRALALLHHPDKSNNKNSNELFQNIHEAYKCLLYHEGNDTTIIEDESSHKYSSFVSKFFNHLFQGYQQQDLWTTILENISTSCKERVVTYLYTLDMNQLIKTYKILTKYQYNLHLEPDIFEIIKSVIEDKLTLNEKIILNPNIDDLYERNVYKLNIHNQDIFVPLWHSQLTYDINDGEVVIECIPDLPNNTYVDVDNNVHLNLLIDVVTLLNEYKYTAAIGDRNVLINGSDIRFQDKQTIIQKNQGIPIPNTQNPFDVSNISDLYIHITLSSIQTSIVP